MRVRTIVMMAVSLAWFGCSQDARQRPTGTRRTAGESPDTSPPVRTPAATGRAPRGIAEQGQAVPNGAAPPAELPLFPAREPYREKDDVIAIVHRARELHDRFQFQASLDLVARALEVDPQSPAALDLQRQLVELLQRIRDDRPGTKQRATFHVVSRQD